MSSPADITSSSLLSFFGIIITSCLLSSQIKRAHTQEKKNTIPNPNCVINSSITRTPLAWHQISCRDYREKKTNILPQLPARCTGTITPTHRLPVGGPITRNWRGEAEKRRRAGTENISLDARTQAPRTAPYPADRWSSNGHGTRQSVTYLTREARVRRVRVGWGGPCGMGPRIW